MAPEGDGFDDLRDVERRMREEIREEAREVEQLVEESELRARTLQDVALELINRGDRVLVVTPTRSFTGRLLFSGRDFLTIEDHESIADIYLFRPCTIQVIEKAPTGGTTKPAGPGSFEMRLVEHHGDNTELEVAVATTGEVLKARVAVVGQDHVILRNRSKEEWIVPFEAVSWVVRRSRSR